MAYLVSHTAPASTKQKSFNGLSRTKEGMLYLTSIDPKTGYKLRLSDENNKLPSLLTAMYKPCDPFLSIDNSYGF